MEPVKTPTPNTENEGTQTVEDTTRQTQPAHPQPQVIIANPAVQYATIRPVNPVYVVPNNSRQVMYANDDVFVDVVPVPKTKVIVANQPVPAVCTSSVPQLFYCTTDKKELISQVKYKSDKGMLCCWICLFILCFPFSLLFLLCWPLGYREAIHTCPECHKEVGRVPMLF